MWPLLRPLESQVESWLDSLIQSLLGSLHKSLLESLHHSLLHCHALERRASATVASTDQFLCWSNSECVEAQANIRLQSVHALTFTLTPPTFLTKCFWCHHNHSHHHHHPHQHHHQLHHIYHHQPQTECLHIHPKSMGNLLQNQLTIFSRRSTCPDIQLTMFRPESQAAIVNSMTFRHCEIMLWCPHYR